MVCKQYIMLSSVLLHSKVTISNIVQSTVAVGADGVFILPLSSVLVWMFTCLYVSYHLSMHPILLPKLCSACIWFDGCLQCIL